MWITFTIASRLRYVSLYSSYPFIEKYLGPGTTRIAYLGAVVSKAKWEEDWFPYAGGFPDVISSGVSYLVL